MSPNVVSAVTRTGSGLPGSSSTSAVSRMSRDEAPTRSSYFPPSAYQS